MLTKVHDTLKTGLTSLWSNAKELVTNSGSVNHGLTPLALTALSSLAFFSFIGLTGAQSTCLDVNPCQLPGCGKLTDWNTCPALELQEPALASCQKAIEVFKTSEIQNLVTDSFMKQADVLNALHNSPNITNFFFDKRLHQKMKQFSKTLPYKNHMMNRDSLFQSHVKQEIDVSKLLSDNPSALNPLSRIFQSYIGLNLAKLGDKDILLFVSSDPTADHNGAFGVFTRMKEFLTTVSQKHPIHFIDASSVTELLDKAEKTTRDIGNIKIMIINGHGSPYNLQLGPGWWDLTPSPSDSFITTSLADSFPVDLDGTIILHACSNGQGGLNNWGNLVNHLSCLHPGRSVVGLTKDKAPLFFVEDLAQRKFTFKQPTCVPSPDANGRSFAIINGEFVPCKNGYETISYCAKASLKQEPYPFSWLPFTTHDKCHIEEC